MHTSVNLSDDDFTYVKKNGLKFSSILRKAINEIREQREYQLNPNSQRTKAMHNTIKRLVEVLEKHGITER